MSDKTKNDLLPETEGITDFGIESFPSTEG